MISVIIPTYNYAAYICEAIESILLQSLPAYEIIVIDDGSVDETKNIVKQYQGNIIYHYQNNQGISSARNVGVEMSRGEYLAFLDADDKWTPDKLLLQMNALTSSASMDMSFSSIQNFHCASLSPADKARLYCVSEPMPGYIATTILIRKKSFLNVGFFDPTFKVGEFIDWYRRAMNMGLNHQMVEKTLALRRIHKGHLTTKKDYQPYCRVLKKTLRST
jgi:GT2 family glycosyltransferase